MSTASKNTQRKAPAAAPAKRKNAYPNALPVTPEEVLEINSKMPDGGWLSLDTANENTSNENMSKNNVRYLQVLFTGTDGKARPMKLKMPPFRTASGIKLQEIDGKLQKMVYVQSRIDITEKDDLNDRVNKVIEEQFPNLPDDKYDVMHERQLDLMKKQLTLYLARAAIHTEFERLLNDEDVQESINWTPTDKQVVRGNIQYERKWNKETDDKSLKNKNKQVDLEQPIIRDRLKADKNTDELWGDYYDLTNQTGNKKAIAMAVNPMTKKVEKLNLHSIGGFLTRNSVVRGETLYQCCLCKDGAILHSRFTSMSIRRAAPSEAKERDVESDDEDMADFGGEFAPQSEVPSSSTAAETKKDDDDDELADLTQQAMAAKLNTASLDEDD